MSTVAAIWNRVFTALRADPRRPRIPVRIPDDHVVYSRPTPAPDEPGASVVKPKKDYLLVVLNQLFLADSRQWFTTIEPVVFASSEFLYNGATRIDPVVVGPMQNNNLPKGTVLRNTTVFGPHPYSGGAFTFTFVLSRLPVGNVARDVLQVVEAVSSTLVPNLAMAAYASIGRVVVDGFDRLMNLNGLAPLLGLRETVNPDSGPPLQSGRWALIDEDAPDPSRLWVIDDVLMQGSTRDKAQPYRESDFILYQFARPHDGRRSDVDALPINSLWRAAIEAASKPTAWAEAKANFGAMISAVATSPDLTWDDGQALIAERRAQLMALHDSVVANSLLSGAQPRARPDPVQNQIAEILELG